MNAFREFTEDGFRALLRRLQAAGYRFARFGDAGGDRHVLWRHDVDFSIHRAASLAKIEAEERATAIYFVNPHSTFYNLAEPDITMLVQRIAGFGHEIGLHFDADAYKTERWTPEALGSAIRREQILLELLLQCPIRVVSWHNPDLSNLLEFEQEEMGGLINAYSSRLQRDYVYCSDSNGYWRFKSMAEIISEGHDRLHLLTHPEWWTPEPMAPSDRIDRAILGRARKTRADYDAKLQYSGRLNITE